MSIDHPVPNFPVMNPIRSSNSGVEGSYDIFKVSADYGVRTLH